MNFLTARRATVEPSNLKMERQLSKPKKNSWTGYADEVYNKDRKIADYIKMVETDSQIKAALDLIQNSLSTQRYMVKPASEKKEDKEIAGFVEEVLEGMSIPFRRVRKDMLTAIQYGYSVSEIVYRYDEEKKKIVWDYLRSIDIETLQDCFIIDKYGDVKTVVQKTGSGLDATGTGYDDIKIPAEYCLIYSFDSEFNNPYGRSILRQCYDHWFMKRKVQKYYNIYLQKLQNPFLHGKTANRSDADVLDKALDQVESGRTHVVTNTDDAIDVIETKNNGEGFLQAIQHHNMMIFRRMGIPSLIFGQDQASGSYAQSQSHQEVFHEFLEGVLEEQAGLMQEKIKELVDLNYSPENYPKFYFEPLMKDQVIQLLMALAQFANTGSIDTNMPWFQNLIYDAVVRNSDVVITPEDKNWEHVVDYPIKLVPKPEDMNKGRYTYTYVGKGDEQAQPAKPQQNSTLQQPQEPRKSIAAEDSEREKKIHAIREYLKEEGLLK